MWKPCYSPYACRLHRRIRKLRKSERIRLAELEIVRLNFELEYIKSMLNLLLEVGGMKMPDLDAGKWYSRKPNRPDIPNN